MIKITITKNNQVTNQAVFASSSEADAWLAQEEANKSFGKPAGFYPISQLSQEELAQEISRKEVDELGNPIEALIEIPAQYQVVVEDITAQVNQDQVNRDALNYLSSTDWYAIREYEGGTPMPLSIKDERAAARLRIVR